MATQSKRLPYGLVMAEVDPQGSRGCLVEFRARSASHLQSEPIQQFMRAICQHILEKAPRHVSRKDVSWEEIRSVERTFRAEAEETFASSDRLEDHLLEKMASFYQATCLMEQPFLSDPSRWVGQVWEQLVQETAQPLEIQQIACFDARLG